MESSQKRQQKIHQKIRQKSFLIQHEREDEKIFIIDGEEISSFEQIQERFGTTPTKFLNQVTRKKKHFLDKDENQHFVEWFSPEMEKLFDLTKRSDMNKVVNRKPMTTKGNDLKTKPTIKKIELP